MERDEWSGNNAGDITPLQEKEAVIEQFNAFFTARKFFGKPKVHKTKKSNLSNRQFTFNF